MVSSGTILLGMAAAALSEVPTQAQTRGGFQLGLEGYDYSYRERFDGETVASDDGTFGGFHVDYVETIGRPWFLRSRFALSYGSVDYRSENGTIDNVSQDVGQLELQVGRDFTLRGATLTAFVGLGSRVLNDHSSGKQTQDGSIGYDREVAYAYVPAGVSTSMNLSGRARLRLNAQYNWVVGGDSTSNFSAVDPEFPDVKVELTRGHGIEASAAIELPLGRHALNFGPFVRHWNIERSETFRLVNPGDASEQIEFFEPANRTTELGIRLSFSF